MKYLNVAMLLIIGGLSLECGGLAPLWPVSDMLQLVAQPSQFDKLKHIEQLKLETTYDSASDKTTVRLPPVKISGERAQYQSLHMSPFFTYPGKTPVRPSIIDFELQTVVKGRLRTDLYVLFIIDGEKVFMSSSRWAIKRPIPGRVWMGERLIFRMPYETLLKLAAAKKVEITMDAVRFDIGPSQHQSIQDFLAEINKIH